MHDHGINVRNRGMKKYALFLQGIEEFGVIPFISCFEDGARHPIYVWMISNSRCGEMIFLVGEI